MNALFPTLKVLPYQRHRVSAGRLPVFIICSIINLNVNKHPKPSLLLLCSIQNIAYTLVYMVGVAVCCL